MFDKQVYIDRRNELKNKFKNGILFFPGNDEATMNYAGNTYKFRQDSSFLYYFGIDIPGITGLIDLDDNKEYLFGYEFTVEDTIWMGPQPKLAELAGLTGIEYSKPVDELKKFLKSKKKKQSKIHFLPPYRAEQILKLSIFYPNIGASATYTVSEFPFRFKFDIFWIVAFFKKSVYTLKHNKIFA